jgi:hypothetical protein
MPVSRMRFWHLLLIAAASVAFGTVVADAQITRLELHTIQSQTPTDQEFLTGKKDAKSATIAAELRIPRPGNDRLPAVVLLHGSSGVSGFVDDWARELNSLGVAVLILDSFTAAVS